MKKLFKIISAAIVSTAFLGTLSASAATCSGDFTITGTGPLANNTISCNEINNVVATCNNNVVVLNFNDQNGISGSATVSNNTGGGSAVTGSIANDNNNNIDLAAVCEGGAVVTPGGGGGGGGALPEVLPNTGAMDLIPLLSGTIGMSIIAVVLSRLGLAAYRHQSNI